MKKIILSAMLTIFLSGSVLASECDGGCGGNTCQCEDGSTCVNDTCTS